MGGLQRLVLDYRSGELVVRVLYKSTADLGRNYPECLENLRVLDEPEREALQIRRGAA